MHTNKDKNMKIGNEDNVQHIRENKNNYELPPLSITSLKVFSRGKTIKYRFMYIKHVAWSMISGRWYASTMTHNLDDESDEIFDRLMTEWATQGVVAALLMGLSYSTYSSPVDNTNNLQLGGIDASEAIAVVAFTSVCLYMITIFTTVLLSMGLMTLPRKYSNMFVQELKFLVTIPEASVVSSSYLFLINLVLVGYTMYGDEFVKYAVPILFGCVIIGLVIWNTIIFVLDREGGLWDEARKEKLSKKG